MKKILEEFKKFISRGNVLDMAIGIIIGSSFSQIVTSLVNDIFMPLIGLILGGLNFSGLSITIKDSTISYGLFIQNIVNFLITASAIFIFIKIINKFKKEKNEPKKETKKEEVILLEDIKELLKKQIKDKTK